MQQRLTNRSGGLPQQPVNSDVEMVAKPSERRVLVITIALAAVLAFTAIWFYHPAVHRKLLVFLVLLAVLPLGVALRVVDRVIFRSQGLSRLSENVRTGLVALAGIALSAVVMALGYALAVLAGVSE